MVGFLMANLFGHEKQCAWIEEFRNKVFENINLSFIILKCLGPHGGKFFGR